MCDGTLHVFQTMKILTYFKTQSCILLTESQFNVGCLVTEDDASNLTASSRSYEHEKILGKILILTL